MQTEVRNLIEQLRQMGNPADAEGMRRFAIGSGEVLGIRIVDLRALARTIGRNPKLALSLWRTGIHEARLLAVLLIDGKSFPEKELEAWLPDLASWDLCDQLCMALARSPLAFAKAMEWSHREAEFQKRAGFSLMAVLAVHRTREPDEAFLPFLQRIEEEAGGERHFVKKSVNWALRQIGKRSAFLHPPALATAERIAAQGSRSARWIASDARRELEAKGPRPAPRR